MLPRRRGGGFVPEKHSSFYSQTTQYIIMKNYITVAALLAAGTAFANADVTLINVDFTDYADWAAAQTDGWSQAKTSGGNHGADAVVNDSLGLTTGGAWTQTKVSHNLSSSINLGIDGSYTITYTATKGNNNNAALQFALVGTNYSIVVGSSYNTDPGLYAGSVGDANVLTSTTTWYSFQDTSPGTTMEITKGATISSEAISTGELTYTLTLTTSASGNDTLTVSAGSYSGTYTFSSDAELTAVGFMLEGGDGIGQSVKDVSVVSSAIPEPSAFGLLAGLGALALVASRRRRK